MRTSVYIDGLNLYYGALKGTPLKWLDSIKLSTAVLPRKCVALWRPLVNLPVAGRRIATRKPVVLPAGDHVVSGPSSKTLPVGIYPARGPGEKKRPKASAPLPDALVAEFHSVEEKGSDVNLASHLLNDAWKGLFDAAAVSPTTPIS